MFCPAVMPPGSWSTRTPIVAVVSGHFDAVVPPPVPLELELVPVELPPVLDEVEEAPVPLELDRVPVLPPVPEAPLPAAPTPPVALPAPQPAAEKRTARIVQAEAPGRIIAHCRSNPRAGKLESEPGAAGAG
jgi:hypothetical protein